MTGLHAITIRPDMLPPGYESVVEGGPVDQLAGLGQALLASPGWPVSAGAIVCEDPGPVLILAGDFGSQKGDQLATLREQLGTTRIRYVEYVEVEAIASSLAALLREALPDRAAWHFAPVPRGGLIVLGVLSYLLELDPSHIVSADASVDSLVLVDDCALSGARMGTILAAARAPRIAIATLFSVPAVRDALLAKEPAVCDFVSAEDLVDTAPERQGAGYEKWLERWSERGAAYWTGHTDHLVFPWSEPDVGLWNDSEDRLEQAWRLVPPDRCLKNRAGQVDLYPMRRFTRSPGSIRQVEGVVDLVLGERVIVVDLKDDRTLALAGSAASMWSALMATGDRDLAVRQLATEFDVDPTLLERDLTSFIRQMSDSGLITVHDDQAA